MSGRVDDSLPEASTLAVASFMFRLGSDNRSFVGSAVSLLTSGSPEVFCGLRSFMQRPHL